jgi:hypothetical protein
MSEGTNHVPVVLVVVADEAVLHHLVFSLLETCSKEGKLVVEEDHVVSRLSKTALRLTGLLILSGMLLVELLQDLAATVLRHLFI